MNSETDRPEPAVPPWASDRNAIPDEPEDTVYQMEVANRMKEAAFDTHGKVYIAGQSRDVLGYPAGGMTEDYAYGELGTFFFQKDVNHFFRGKAVNVDRAS